MEKLDVHARKTVQGCLQWADQIWPHFWKFVTKEKMTNQELLELDRYFFAQKKYLLRFRQHLRYIYTIDPSKNAVHYLILSTNAFERMTSRLQKIKCHNERQLMHKYGTDSNSLLKSL